MQVTLVSHYGEKSAALRSYLQHLQAEITDSLGAAFSPYEVPQVHGTIIGLEGCNRNGNVENTNFSEYRSESRYIDITALLTFLHGPAIPVFEVQIGGYLDSEDYGFTSQNMHPYIRSFSIQGEIAVAIGWPMENADILDQFRRSFNRFNVLHKWHKKESDFDNDFFLVLGRVARESIGEAGIIDAEVKIRRVMSLHQYSKIRIGSANLQIVAYSDTQLPPVSSRVFPIADGRLTADEFLRLYDRCSP